MIYCGLWTKTVGGRGSKGPYHKKCNNASKKKFDDFGQKIGQFSLFKMTVSYNYVNNHRKP